MNGFLAASGRAGLLALVLGLSLAGCSNLRDSLGLNKHPPDEFNVVTRAPLELPPSLDSLPPPQPGIARPQELQPEQQAMAVLLGGQPVGTLDASAAESMLMAQAETDANETGIRETIDIEHKRITTDRGFIEELQFWREHPDDTEVVIDAKAEKQRLQNNAALGLPANAGDFEAVVVVPEEKGLLEDIF